jgi:two-component system NarL family sensor kinase
MGEDGVIVAITATIVAMLLISIGFIAFIVMFHRSKRKALEQRQAIEMDHVRSMADLEHEIRDSTMEQMGMELHDGIAQELTLVKLYLDGAQKRTPTDEISTASNVLIETIDDLRILARSMTSKRLKDLGLVEALRQEMDRLEKIAGIKTSLQAPAQEVELEERAKMVVVRIAQEFFQNSLKHASASLLTAEVKTLPHKLVLCFYDNGTGFDPTAQEPARMNGIRNMEARARSIGAALALSSSAGSGTRLVLELERHG